MKWIRRHKVLVSNLGLVALLLVGLSFLVFDTARVNPFKRTYAVTVDMDRSGGLQPRSDVTYRGYRVGQVKSISLTEKGVRAEVEIDGSAHIPASGTVAVHALSAAGEQYIDFRPDTDQAPFLEDGAVISRDRVSLPVPIPEVLANSSQLIASINPDRYEVILNEMDKALGGGPDQLRRLINGLSLITTGMDAYLPQTVSLLTNLRLIAGETTRIQPDLGTLTRSSQLIFDQAVAADGELRKAFDTAPGQLSTLGGTVSTNMDPLTRLANDFVRVSKAAQLRAPALSLLFPSLQKGLTAVGVPAHDGEFHTVADVFSRPTCYYNTAPVSPTAIGDGRVPLWNYCVTDNPRIQVRGSANAPRPDVPNNGASMPPGADPGQLSDPDPARNQPR
ncbi:MlaD family protein [Skermania piniformis]|uniref:MCE family protein n=1 Tax=Skermania pinensis TaxID=39122 RepID=A0ABX8S7A0_9ACTN|nr:MlaD family protein [Skermania piniformis]QXQ13728.1 MCE family protein [Skermania piniformis]